MLLWSYIHPLHRQIFSGRCPWSYRIVLIFAHATASFPFGLTVIASESSPSATIRSSKYVLHDLEGYFSLASDSGHANPIALAGGFKDDMDIRRWIPIILGFSSPRECQIPGFLTQQMLSLLQNKLERQISEKGVSRQFLPVSLSRSNSSSAARLTGDPPETATWFRHYITLARSPQPSKSCRIIIIRRIKEDHVIYTFFRNHL